MIGEVQSSYNDISVERPKASNTEIEKYINLDDLNRNNFANSINLKEDSSNIISEDSINLKIE